MPLTIGDLSRNLFANTLNERNSFKLVHNRSHGYNKLATLASILNFDTGGTRIDTVDGKYEYAWDKRNEVIAQIKTVTTSGNNLILTLWDPNYEFFRLKDYVMDSNKYKGRVVATAPGMITIEPTGYTFDTALHFLPNGYVRSIGDLSGVRDSMGKSSLYSIPNVDFNYCQVTREGVKLSRKDKVATLVLFGEQYWFSKQEDDMVVRIANADERTLLHGDRFQYTSSVEGLINGNGGLDWSIKNRNGLYKPLTSKLTRDQFHDILLEHGNRSASTSQRVVLAMGSAALMDMNENFTGDFIKYAGTTNTFGGQTVKGLNVQMYAIGGIEYPIIVLPSLNDSEFYPETSVIPGVRGTLMSNRIYMLDLDPLPVTGNDGKKVPAIERIYWGDDEKLYRCIPGMVGPQNNSTGGNKVGKYQMTSSPADSFSCEFLQDMGWNIADATRMALIEYIR